MPIGQHDFLKDCAGIVLEHQPKPPNLNQGEEEESALAAGSGLSVGGLLLPLPVHRPAHELRRPEPTRAILRDRVAAGDCTGPGPRS